MRKFVFIAVAGLALSALSGCGKVPEVERNAANSALEMAKGAQAEMYASETHRSAVDTIDAAIAAVKEQDSKIALFRSYTKAKDLFVRGEALAREALAQAQAEKERMRTEVKALLDSARAQLEAAEEALKKAPTGKGVKAEIELLRNGLAAARTAFEEAEKEYNSEQFLVAKSKLQAVIVKARSITEDVSKAAAKKQPKKM